MVQTPIPLQSFEELLETRSQLEQVFQTGDITDENLDLWNSVKYHISLGPQDHYCLKPKVNLFTGNWGKKFKKYLEEERKRKVKKKFKFSLAKYNFFIDIKIKWNQ